VGLVTIRQLGVLMQRSHLVITNDSASLHLASALQVPTVAVFGPTDADKYGPTSAQSRTIRRRLFCAPCEQALCRFNHECMRFVSADEVYNAASELLGHETRDMRHEAGAAS
jgi:ADP-heptose:LPS heptosyltransferase